MGTLVIRTGGGLGDIVCCLPAIRGLIERDGAGAVGVAMEAKYHPLLQGYGVRCLDVAHISFGRLRSLLNPRLRKTSGLYPEYDRVANLRGPETLHFRETAGRPYLSRIENFSDACGVIPSDFRPAVFLSDEELAEGSRRVTEISAEGTAVAVQWRSAGAYKDWPHMTRCIELLREAGYVTIAFDETDPLPEASASVVGESLRFVAAMLAACDALVTLDTGLLHLGACVAVPTVAIFGPTDGAMICKHYPNVRVVQQCAVADEVGCQMPCWGRRHASCSEGRSRCLEGVAPQVVPEEVSGILRADLPRPAPAPIARAAGMMIAPAEPRKDPRVSVLMCAWNAQDTIGDALDCVRQQTLQELDIVVYDDGSTDGTVARARACAREDPRVRVVQAPRHMGLTRALNAGHDHCLGQYVARMDADDLCDRTRIAKQVALLDRDERLGMVGCWYYSEAARVVHRAPVAGIAPIDLCGRLPVGGSTIRRAAHDAIGGYDARWPYAQDYDYAARMVTGGWRVERVPEVLYFYRAPEAAISQARNEQQRQCYYQIRSALQNGQRVHPMGDVTGDPAVAVSVVILSHERPDKLIRCVESVLQALPECGELLIVENGSGTATVDRIRKAMAQWPAAVRISELPRNLGVGLGRRHGTGLATGQYVAFFDDDTVLDAECLSLLAAFLEEHASAGVAAAQVRRDGMAEFTGRDVVREGDAVRLDYWSDHLPIDDPRIAQPRQWPLLHGGATMWRRAALAPIFWDPGYFVGFEDIDTMWQASRNGWTLWSVPAAWVQHDPETRAGNASYVRTRRNRARLHAAQDLFRAKTGILT